MYFDRAVYHSEMLRLLRAAHGAALVEFRDIKVYSISIWTDPDAECSAVNFDTRDNSAAKLARLTSRAMEQHARLIAAGEFELAAPLLRLPERNRNPADFAIIELVKVEHEAFRSGGEDQADCWAALEPALDGIAEEACVLFADLPLEEGAIVGVNTSEDWFGRTWELRPQAA